MLCVEILRSYLSNSPKSPVTYPANLSLFSWRAPLRRFPLDLLGTRTLPRHYAQKGASRQVASPKLRRPLLQGRIAGLLQARTLIVWKLDRLGRSLCDLIAMLDDLKHRGVTFRSLTEAIDTETPTGRAMWQMIGVLAELERSLISERTRAGV